MCSFNFFYIFISVEDTIPAITQIGAEVLSNGNQFSTFILPKKDQEYSAEAEMITGISYTYSGEPKMFYKGQQVPHKSTEEGLASFVDWLKSLDSKVVLVAHNCRKFDAKVLVSALNEVNHSLLEEFCEIVIAFADSLRIFREWYPGRSTYAQGSLVTDLLQRQYNAHHAVGDCEALASLLKLQPLDLVKFSFPPMDIFYQFEFTANKLKYEASFNAIVQKLVIKKGLAENIAGSGLSLSHLRLLYKRKQSDGIRDVFVSKNSVGLPRVTSAKKTLDTVIPALAAYFDGESANTSV